MGLFSRRDDSPDGWQAWARRHEERCDHRYETMDKASADGRKRLYEKIESAAAALNVKLDAQTAALNTKLEDATRRQNALILAGFGAVVSALTVLVVMLIHGGGRL